MKFIKRILGIDKIEDKLMFIESSLSALGEKIKEAESLADGAKKEKGNFLAIFNEWLNGKEGE